MHEEQSPAPATPDETPSREAVSPAWPGPVMNGVFGLAGALLGAAAGYAVYRWALGQGFYALAIPGMGAGFGGSLLSRRRSMAVGVICAVVGFVAGVLSEWWHFPFVADKGLPYFLAHLHELRSMTWILLVLGSAMGYWIGRKR